VSSHSRTSPPVFLRGVFQLPPPPTMWGLTNVVPGSFLPWVGCVCGGDPHFSVPPLCPQQVSNAPDEPVCAIKNPSRFYRQFSRPPVISTLTVPLIAVFSVPPALIFQVAAPFPPRFQDDAFFAAKAGNLPLAPPPVPPFFPASRFPAGAAQENRHKHSLRG